MNGLALEIGKGDWVKSFGLRFALLGFLFWVLSEGTLREPLLPLLTVLAGTVTSLALWRPGKRPWRWRRFPRFAAYFLWQSLLGGIDVARRAFSPSMPLEPGFIAYSLRLRDPAAQVFFVWVVSLLPGTVVSSLKENAIQVHALDVENLPIRDKLAELEDHIALLCGESF